MADISGTIADRLATMREDAQYILTKQKGEEVRGSISDSIGAAADAIEEAVRNQMIDVDPTLSLSGQGADAAVTGEALSKRIENCGILPSGAISDITNKNCFYALIHDNTYSDYPEDETIKNALVYTANVATIWEQLLITYVTAPAQSDYPYGHIYYRCGMNRVYGAWKLINPDINLSERLKIMSYDGSAEEPKSLFASRDTEQYCSYITPSWITETLNNIDKSSSIIKFGAARDNAAVLGVEKSTLRSFIYTKNANTSSSNIYALGTENCATLKLTSFSKTLYFYGDSITWGRDGNYSSGQDGYRSIYTIPSIVQRNLGITAINWGVGSQGYLATGGGRTAYQEIMNHDNTQANYFVLAWGVNDRSYIMTNGSFDPDKLGTYLDTDETVEDTLMKEVYKCVRALYYANPFQGHPVQLIMINPWNGINIGSFPQYKYADTTYKALCDEMEKFANYYGIPYIGKEHNPMTGFGINGIISNDGVHPYAEGYKILGNWLSGEIGRVIG